VFAKGVPGADRGRNAIELPDRPINGENRVAPQDGTVSRWMVEICGFVEHLCGVREDKEAVGETFWNPEELQFVSRGLGFQMESSPFPKVGRFPPEVDRDVPDMARENSDELALWPAKLIVKAAKYPFD
jgi:hypothetical protein